ncbi:MAG: methyltetrahydrofolate cobalamin methyltransferase [Thermodesulfobacteriota bacterium]
MIVIAERINSSRKAIAKAIAERDAQFIQAEARKQAEAGADYIDVNAGSFVDQEVECLQWLVQTVQAAVETPLCLDSPDAKAIQAALPLCTRKPMINSITLEPERLEGLLPLVAEHGLPVIALCQSEDAMAETVEDKVRIAGELLARTAAAGIPNRNVYIDPLVYPVSTNPQSALATLQAIREIMTRYEDVHTTCGLTNVSYGMPARKLINRTFLACALASGLDSAIIDPTDDQLYAVLRASLLVMGQDDFAMNFITGFRQGRYA